jgi:uncharacterized protein (TIGR00369 family)
LLLRNANAFGGATSEGIVSALEICSDGAAAHAALPIIAERTVLVSRPAEAAVTSQPFSRLMGVEILSAEATRVTARLQVRADLCTSGNILHGGAVMAFADTLGAVGAFLNLPAGAGTTTIESKTNFFASAKVGETVTAETTPLHIGRRTSVWQTRIARPDGKLMALVTQTQLVLV